ncbi:MAG: LLM class flavin-dependent oxidoreductase [Chloroflexi bacterium]|nr:LLM class flavin-dependent oxidoreductase [Chloroflexota bacterium]
MSVKFGMLVSKQHLEGEDLLRRFDEHCEQVRFIRDLGWHSVCIGQHYLSSPWREFQQVPMLARLKADAGDMLLASTIALTGLRHPVEVAEQMATLDIICEGRFAFGVGLGYRDVEYDSFGVGRADRVPRFVESLRLIDKLWTGDVVNHTGRYFQLNGVQLSTLPVQRPRPPIWMAANNDGAVKRTARMADTWVVNPHAKLATIEPQIQLYRETLKSLGKPFPAELPIIKEVYVADDAETAWRDVAPFLERKYNAYIDWGQHKALPKHDTFLMPFKELTEDRFIIGDVDYCVAELERHRERLGVNHFIFRVQYPGMKQDKILRTLELLGKKVAPRLMAA